ncbi:MAG: metalloregulator ArsR/SmtB family transcription factor [Chloroflexota bacterium]
MVNHPALDSVFSALADPTRRAILQRLANGTASVTELAEPFAENMSLPAVSKHLRVLETAGLIARQKDGRVHHLRLRPAPLRDAAEWLAFYRQFWDEQFDALAQYLQDIESEISDE